MPSVIAVVAEAAGPRREQAVLGPKAPGAAETELAFFLRLRGESQNIKWDTVFRWMTESALATSVVAPDSFNRRISGQTGGHVELQFDPTPDRVSHVAQPQSLSAQRPAKHAKQTGVPGACRSPETSLAGLTQPTPQSHRTA